MANSSAREDKPVVLVTGASNGIGKTTVEHLAARGFRVFAGARRPDAVRLATNVEVVALDVTDDDSVANAVGVIIKRAGRIDGLVNNAGGSILGAIEETSLAQDLVARVGGVVPTTDRRADVPASATWASACSTSANECGPKRHRFTRRCSSFRSRGVATSRRLPVMGLLTFALNVTLDGCIDHRAGIVDDEMLDYFTHLMDGAGAMLFGRTTYELMESAWPAVARDEKSPRAMRDWAVKLEAKPKYVVSASRHDFPWVNTKRVEGELLGAVQALKDQTPRGILVGSPKLSAALEELGLIDEYRIVVHPVLAGHGPTLFQGLPHARHLELIATARLKSGAVTTHYRRKEG